MANSKCEGLVGSIGGSCSSLASIDASFPSPQLLPSRVSAPTHHHHYHAAPSFIDKQRNTTTSNHTGINKLDLSPEHIVARQELLRDTFFPVWRDDASSGDVSHPDEMQKKDPLATQIWKLYKQTKLQLPNHERMENLTWRMMAMNLSKQREQARYVSPHPGIPPPRASKCHTDPLISCIV